MVLAVTPGPGVVLDVLLLVVGEVLLDELDDGVLLDDELLELVGLDDVALLLELDGLDEVVLLLDVVVVLVGLEEVVEDEVVEDEVVEDEDEVVEDEDVVVEDEVVVVDDEVVVELLLVGELLVVVGLVEDEEDDDVEVELLGVVVGVVPQSGRSPLNG
ncbi:hypothetical protein BKN51_14700 [Amycolatopsis sp. BJA-103]|nr:hypothetical protein BKN51_14700 [Amycolatopsis sp. BJA-103]